MAWREARYVIADAVVAFIVTCGEQCLFAGVAADENDDILAADGVAGNNGFRLAGDGHCAACVEHIWLDGRRHVVIQRDIEIAGSRRVVVFLQFENRVRRIDGRREMIVADQFRQCHKEADRLAFALLERAVDLVRAETATVAQTEFDGHVAGIVQEARVLHGHLYFRAITRICLADQADVRDDKVRIVDIRNIEIFCIARVTVRRCRDTDQMVAVVNIVAMCLHRDVHAGLSLRKCHGTGKFQHRAAVMLQFHGQRRIDSGIAR